MSEFDVPTDSAAWDGGEAGSAEDGADLLADFSLADLDLPELDLPELDLPEFDLFDVDLPELPDLPDLPDLEVADAADSFQGLVESVDIPDFVADLTDSVDLPDLSGFEFGDVNLDLDVIGADPDEEGLWGDLMLDLNADVNPYVAN